MTNTAGMNVAATSKNRTMRSSMGWEEMDEIARGVYLRRLVSAARPRRGVTRLHGISARRPRRRRDPSTDRPRDPASPAQAHALRTEHARLQTALATERRRADDLRKDAAKARSALDDAELSRDAAEATRATARRAIDVWETRAPAPKIDALKSV